MLNKIKGFIAVAAGFAYLLAARTAALAQTAGISEKTAEEVSAKVVELVKSVTIPFGSALIFVSIIITAYKVIASANKPEERAKVLGSIPYTLVGGLLLGGALVVSGFIVSLMLKVGQ